MIAWAALILWPMVAIAFFQRFSLAVAVSVTIIGGFLLLPEKTGLNLPVLPTLNKRSIPSLIALVMTAVMLAQRKPDVSIPSGWIPKSPVILILLTILFLGVFGTVLTNQDPLFYGPRFVPGMRIYDAFSFMLDLLIVLIPMLVARRVFATPDNQRILLTVLAVSALIYTIPALWEVRMSPQLHRQIYGFFQHSFGQQVRNDGFRSMVFLGHGLSLSIFLALTMLCAATLMRVVDPTNRSKWAMAVGWLLLVLVLNKSLGALLIALVFLPLVMFLRPRLQLLTAACIAGVVLTYPVLRGMDIIPIDRVVALAEDYDAQRAQSLVFRVDNEEILLDKASERPLFGWGGYGRNRVYSAEGADVSTTDGEWIIHIGVGGWVRYIGFFGLLCWPIIGLFLSKRDQIDPVCAMLVLVLCAKLVDLLPNSDVAPYIWLIAGSLIGRMEISLASLGAKPAVAGPEGQTATRYSRSFVAPEPSDPPEIVDPEPTQGLAYTRAKTIKHRRTRAKE